MRKMTRIHGGGTVENKMNRFQGFGVGRDWSANSGRQPVVHEEAQMPRTNELRQHRTHRVLFRVGGGGLRGASQSRRVGGGTSLA